MLINDLAEARRAINGGTHGLDNFRAAYQAGQRLTGHLISTVSASAISPPPPIPARSAQESASGPVSASGSTASAVVPRSQQVGSQINACDTGLIQGLSHQVLEKLMLMKPGVLTRIDHPLIDCSGSQNNAYLQTNAYNALVRAVEQRESRLLINSCLRTPMQQYLLYEQKQRGLCGITAAAPPPNSNHNSGLAIDIEDAHGWRPFLEDHGWHWIGAFDPMHFDYQPGGVDLGELQVKAFQELWNDHHPDAQITADGLWGPATAACVDRSPAQGFGIGPSLTRGMMSPAVGRLQLLLRKVLNMNPEQLSADCQYGSATAKAVASFQASQGLPQSGQADGSTIKALEQVSGESLQLE